MKKKFFVFHVITIAVVVLNMSGFAHAVEYIQMRPLEQVIKTDVGSIKPSK